MPSVSPAAKSSAVRIERRGKGRGRVVGQNRGDEVERPAGDEHAGRAAEHREQARLDEQLRDELQPARAERQADRHLVGAPGGAREEQVGDVGAGDEEDERGHAEEEQQRRLASPWTELCPRQPSSISMPLALNRAIVWSLMPFWSGASTSLTICR